MYTTTSNEEQGAVCDGRIKIEFERCCVATTHALLRRYEERHDGAGRDVVVQEEAADAGAQLEAPRARPRLQRQLHSGALHLHDAAALCAARSDTHSHEALATDRPALSDWRRRETHSLVGKCRI